MNTKKIINITIIILSVGLQLNAADSLHKNDTVFQTKLDTPAEQKLWSSGNFAKWQNNSDGTTSLCITVPKEKAKDGNMVHRSIDLSKCRGYKLLLECRLKAENVTQPSLSYFGAKFMIHYKSAKEGEL